MAVYQTYDEWKNRPNVGRDIPGSNISKDAYYNDIFYENYKTGDPTRDRMLVAPLGEPNALYVDLLQARSDYINSSSAPYEKELFAGMSYGNPNLQQDYINQAIPQVQQNIKDAQQVTSNTMRASGLAFDPTEQKINARLATLRSEENIAGAANTIRQRLRERDLNTALGSGATASYSMLSNQG